MTEKKPTLDHAKPPHLKHRRLPRIASAIVVVVIVLLLAELLREWLFYGKWAFLIG